MLLGAGWWWGNTATSGSWAKSWVGEDTPRSRDFYPPQAVRGRGTGGPLLGAFSFSRVGASGGKGLEAVFTKNFKKMSKVHIKEGRSWGLLSESGFLPEAESPLNKCRAPLPHFLGVDRTGPSLFRL